MPQEQLHSNFSIISPQSTVSCRQSMVPLNIVGENNTVIQKTSSKTTYFTSRYAADAINKHANSVKVFEGSPDTVLEMQNVFFIPGYTSLYTYEGERIAESCIRRGSDLSELIDAGPELIATPKDYVTVTDPILYLSYFWNHWGHFLTECISRLWSRVEIPDMRNLPAFYAGISGGNINPHYLDLLRAFGLNYGDNLNVYERPILFDKVFVPEASFMNRGMAYMVHKRVVEVISDYCLPIQEGSVSGQPVFISRALIDYARKIVDEWKFDHLFSNSGAQVIYLERHSVQDQINILENNSRFVGCWGAAFHGLAMSRRVKEVESTILCEGLINSNYLMFDAICGNTVRYVDCLRPAPGLTQKWPYTVSVVQSELLAPLLKTDFGIDWAW